MTAKTLGLFVTAILVISPLLGHAQESSGLSATSAAVEMSPADLKAEISELVRQTDPEVLQQMPEELTAIDTLNVRMIKTSGQMAARRDPRAIYPKSELISCVYGKLSLFLKGLLGLCYSKSGVKTLRGWGAGASMGNLDRALGLGAIGATGNLVVGLIYSHSELVSGTYSGINLGVSEGLGLEYIFGKDSDQNKEMYLYGVSIGRALNAGFTRIIIDDL